ncbi:transcription factor MAMYB [Typha latifolia]|uniref:transcription factor MAMYB n=1 Tax=Typha latifolia TaxID=4733 RepID=UPI003C30AE01
MDFFEDEARPRFVFRGGSGGGATSAEQNSDTLGFSKLHFFLCLSAASVVLLAAFSLVSSSQTLATFLLWSALSLLLAPFAPSSVTGGDIHVGAGDLLPDPTPSPTPTEPSSIPARRSRSRKTIDSQPPSLPPIAPKALEQNRSEEKSLDPDPNTNRDSVGGDEKEWTDDDLDLLKKQIAKNPVGKPQRWERIAEAFRGRHALDSVIRTAKSLPDKRPTDSFQQFLKHRKPLDKRTEADKNEILMEDSDDLEKKEWSAGDDLALLNALKVFPKDATMRWEKIAAAVPGKSKAGCIKRVAELKKDFRSSKASES